MKKTTLGVLILGAGLLLAGCGKQATSGQQSVSVGIFYRWFNMVH
ncbi:ABC transporter substrate-binding protein [Lactiplantibacillus plantarum]|nr:ABC transporter substrate-binding protein [Lactiplantibacillus plantarum]